MMKLHHLDISGFKSFVDPVHLKIAGGITGIVGPNGCGKSNIADAITWVLGEQSAKSLRGDKMEDVIFAGTDKRKPVGMADVTLTLLTDPSFPFAVDGKLQIGRRVFRTGQSQYRLNGKVVRLKEVKDLLMDTGLGIRAYSVIEQGKIGMILSGKPQERRKLLEEAAGITRYKARKRIAEVKLEEATANLLRLDDIISEVGRAVRTLRRQAGAAKRYQAKEKEYRQLLRQVLLGRWTLVRHRLEELERRLAEMTQGDAEASAAIHRAEAELAEGREELDRLSRALAERHQVQASFAATIEGRQEFLRGSRRTLEDLAQRLEAGRRATGQRGERVAESRQAVVALGERTAVLTAERDEAARQVAEDDARITAAQQAATQAEARLEGLRREMLASLGRVDQLRAKLQQEQVEIDKRRFRERFLDQELERLGKQLREAETGLETIVREIATAETQIAETTERRAGLAQTLDALLRREAETGEERRRLETELAGLRQRRQILLELSKQHAERRRALTGKLAEIGVDEPRFLADALHPAQGWERSIDHFLGDLADAVEVAGPGAGAATALELARQLAGQGGSGSFLRALPEGAPLPEIEDEALSASLGEALGISDELARALPPAYLVERVEDATRLAAQHPGVAFLSRDRRVCIGGLVRVQAAEAAPGVLARGSELETIEKRIPEAEEALRRGGETLRHLVAERTRHAGEIQRLDDRLAELRRAAAVAQARRQDGAGRLGKLRAEHGALVAERGELGGQLSAAGESRERLGEQLRELEQKHQGLAQSFDRVQAEVEQARSTRESLREAGAGRRGRLELLEERLTAHRQDVVRAERQIAEGEEQLAGWHKEEEALERRRRELELGIERAEEELQVALERQSAAQDEVLGQQRQLDARRETLRQLEEKLHAERDRRDHLRSRLEQMRIDRAGLRQDGEHIAVSYREEFRRYLPGTAPKVEAVPIPPAPVETALLEPGTAGEEQEEAAETEVMAEAVTEVMTEEEEIPPMDLAKLTELEAELARAKSELERLGPVNVLAAQEFDEQEQRYEFLTTQRADVAGSVERLKNTIREINQTSSERFLATFQEVNRTFGETFSKLFRGGEAEMRLLDETDLLDTGIEIVARPPGKRLQNLMLMSGGEKALTAVALLFALFQSKPSPFCILDEVDAPLDDSNVVRFAQLLTEMANGTQFLVITHNKLTMEVASTLYGVTMEERGVSKLVAVELEEVQPARQALTA